MSTTLTASTTAQLNADIDEANAAASGSYIIDILNTIDQTANLDAINLQAGVMLTIDGGGSTVDGGGLYTGFDLDGSSAVTLQNLVLSDSTSTLASGTLAGSITIASDATVDQTGNVTIGSSASPATITNDGVYDIIGLFNIDSGAAAGSEFINNGTLEETGVDGFRDIAIDITDTGTLSVVDSASHLLFMGPSNSFSGTYIGGMIDYGSGTTDVLGTIDMIDEACTTSFGLVNQNGVGTLSAGSTISNYGTWNLTSDNGILAADPSNIGGATFNDYGTLAKTGGSGTTVIGVEFFSGSATINIDSGTLAFDSDSVFIDDETTISGAGTFSIGGGGADYIEHSITVSTSNWIITDAGTVVEFDGALTYAGSFTEQSGATLTLEANLTLNGSASFANATVNGTGELTTDGPTSVTGGVTFGSGVTLTGTGLVSIGSSSTLNALGTVASGKTIEFVGTNGVLDIGTASGFSGTIQDFASGDTLAVSTTITKATPGTFGSGITPLVLKDGSTTVATLSLEGNYQGDTFTVTNPSAGTYDINTPCYCRGTLIRTECGEVPVEALTIGDKVLTKSGEKRPIKWIGRRGYRGRFIMGRRDVLPICIRAGALDDRVPQRDLWLSPHHALYLDGVLIEAKDLINGVSIVQADRVEKVEYFHIELEAHDVIIAQGALAESFIDDDSRGMFSNAHEYRQLYGDLATGLSQFCAPRLEDGYRVETVRRRIAVRAGVSAEDEPRLGGLRGFVDHVSTDSVEGWAQNMEHPEAPVCLDIYTGGRLIGQVLANRYREDLAKARLGSGRHAFVFTPPSGMIVGSDKVRVRRSLDAAALPDTRRPQTAA